MLYASILIVNTRGVRDAEEKMSKLLIPRHHHNQADNAADLGAMAALLGVLGTSFGVVYDVSIQHSIE